MFKCSPVNFPVKPGNYCFPYFYMTIFPWLVGITFTVIFARYFQGNLVQSFNFIFFIKFCILENNFLFYVSFINFKFPWKNVCSNLLIVHFTILKHFVCLCWRLYISGLTRNVCSYEKFFDIQNQHLVGHWWDQG